MNVKGVANLTKKGYYSIIEAIYAQGGDDADEMARVLTDAFREVLHFDANVKHPPRKKKPKKFFSRDEVCPTMAT